jgi:hypothetical protein
MEILFKKVTFKLKKYDTKFNPKGSISPQQALQILQELFDIFTDLNNGRNYLIICKVEHRSNNQYETILPIFCCN